MQPLGQGFPMGSGVSDSSWLVVNSCRSVLTRKISCLRPAHAGGGGGCCCWGGGRFGGGLLGSGDFGGGFLGAAVFLGVGLRVGFFGGAARHTDMGGAQTLRSLTQQASMTASKA